MDVGLAAARFLTDSIERLAAPMDAPAHERLPHAVLRTCFVDGAKAYQAAVQLGLSERQLTRERGRAISLLTSLLTSGRLHAPHVPEAIPRVDDFVPRPDLVRSTEDALGRSRAAHLHGPRGIGKSSLAAEVAVSQRPHSAVWWYRFRRGVNDTLLAVIFELSEWLYNQGLSDPAAYVTPNVTNLDISVATRLTLRALGETTVLMVLDDVHIVEEDPSITGFFEEALLRTPPLRMITSNRMRPGATRLGEVVDVPPLRIDQSERLLAEAGMRLGQAAVRQIHAWTGGNPHLLRLAAGWLHGADRAAVFRGIGGFVDLPEVQGFCLDNLAEFLESADRPILESATVFRRGFSEEALGYVAQQGRGVVRDASQRFFRSYLTRRSDQGFEFLHDIMRNYVYERLDPELRTTFHLRAAGWFHSAGDENESDYHRGRAG